MYLRKARYEFVRDYAWRTLLRADVRSLPVNLFDVCKTLGIHMRKYSENIKFVEQLKKEDCPAFTFKGVDKDYYIFYNDNIRPYAKMRQKITHELGHIELKHTSTEGFENNKEFELEANMFTQRFLAPAVVLYECNIIEAEDIMIFCEMTVRASHTRSKRMKKLKEENFCQSPLEKMVLKKFKKFIIHYNKYK